MSFSNAKKRILSWLLTIMMVAGMIFTTEGLAVTTYADEELEEIDKGALSVASDTTILLTEDTKTVYTSITITASDAKVTIKGDGYLQIGQLSSSSGYGTFIVNSGNVQVVDAYSYTGDITINGGNVEFCKKTNTDYSIYDSSGYGNITVNDGTAIFDGSVCTNTFKTYAPAKASVTGDIWSNRNNSGDDETTKTSGSYYSCNIPSEVVILGKGTTVNGSIGTGGAYPGSVVINGAAIEGDYIETGSGKSNYDSSGGSITITDGTISVDGISVGTGYYYFNGIHTGKGIDGTFKSTSTGTAYIKANTLPDLSNFESGIIDQAGDITVYGNQTITSNMSIKSYDTLTIKPGAKLTVDGCTLDIAGKLVNNGEISVGLTGTLSGSGTVTSDSTGTFSQVIPFDENALNAPSDFSYDGKDHYSNIAIAIGNVVSSVLGGITLNTALPKSDDKYSLSVTYKKTDTSSAVTATAAKNVGIYTATLKDTDTNESVSKTFTISQADIENANVSIDNIYYYEGKDITPSPIVTMNGLTLTKNTDYTVTHEQNTGVGTGKITITGINNYTGTQTLYYTIVEKEFSITYVLNGGSLSSSAKKNYTISSQFSFLTPTRKGYTFDGWYKDSTFTNPISGITEGSTGNLTVYAKWTAYPYSIILDGNNATSGTMNTINTAYGSTVTLPTNGYKKTGYTFAGWNTKADGTGVSYSNQASLLNLTDVKNGTVTLYAQWTRDTYTISYVLNGGTNSSSNPTSYNVESNTITLANPVKTGYTFAGWYSDSAFATKVTTISKGSTGNRTFYAKWTANQYSIIYAGNGSTSGSMSNQTATYGSSYTLNTNAYVRTGYTFAGWNTKADGTGTKYADKAAPGNLTAVNGAKITLYALWTKITYKITYVVNGGTGNTNPSTYVVDTANITLKSLTRTGYTFAGWYSDSAMTKKVTTIAKGSTGNRTFYAKWTANKYTITFAGNGSTSGKMKNQSATYDVSYSLKANTYTKTDYVFAGWNTKADGSGTKYADKATPGNLTSVNGGKVTLYAQWTLQSTSFSSVKSTKNGTIDLKWTKKSAATGYQIRYAKNSSMSGAKTVSVSKSSTTTKTISKLSKGTTYYVQIRTVGKNGSKVVYGDWSASKSVTTLNIYISDKSLTLYEGGTYTLTVNDAKSSNVTWTSSDTSVCNVSKGKLTAKNSGTATITAKYNGYTMKCKVTVKKISISATSASIDMGCQKQLSVNCGTATVSWSTSDSSIARVTSAGLVTAVGKGSATITAKVNGKKFTCKVKTDYPDFTLNLISLVYEKPKYTRYYSLKYLLSNNTGTTITIDNYAMIYCPYSDSTEKNMIAEKMGYYGTEMVTESNPLIVRSGSSEYLYGFEGTSYYSAYTGSLTAFCLKMNGYEFIAIVDGIDGSIQSMKLNE